MQLVQGLNIEDLNTCEELLVSYLSQVVKISLSDLFQRTNQKIL